MRVNLFIAVLIVVAVLSAAGLITEYWPEIVRFAHR
jgi:hypothetical protein